MKKGLVITGLVVVMMVVGVASAFAHGGVHYVQPGENLVSIALQYGVSVQQLMDANAIADADYIYVGQKLIIPGGQSDNTETGWGGHYTVVVGDTLAGIAAKFNTTVEALFQANALTNTDMIYVGQVLNVPQKPAGLPPVVPAVPAYAPVYGCSTYYTVKAGDTLSAIAWRYGVSVNALLAANAMVSDVIYEWQRLCVPGGHKPVETPISGGKPTYEKPAAPEYVDISKTWDGSVTVVKPYNKWTGSQTADFADPDGQSTIMVRSVGADNVPMVIKKGDFVMKVATGLSAEFGLATFGMKGVEPGTYQVWVEGVESDVVEAVLKPGQRILVEFKYVTVSQNPPLRSPSGWSGQITSNTSGTEPANGVWSVIVAKAPAIGLPVSIRSEGNDFYAKCFTGTKPELGPAACDFGGLWPGKYTITLEGAGIAVEVFVDGQGTAEVVFDKR